jgi:hypothetical protein
MKNKRWSLIFLKIFFSFFLLVTIFGLANQVLAQTTINPIGVNVSGVNCSGGSGPGCSTLINNNTTVLQSPGNTGAGTFGFYSFYQPLDFGGTYLPTGQMQSQSTTFGAVGSSVPVNGTIRNIPSLGQSLFAQYVCSVGGTVQSQDVPIAADGSWSTNLPNNGVCTMEIIANTSGGAVPATCDGSAGNPCGAFQCRSGQCSWTTTDRDGNPLAPGTQNTCTSSCATSLTASVLPSSAQMVLGTDPYVDYVITFLHSGPANTLAVEIPCPSGAECELFDSSNNQVVNFASGGYSASGNYSSSFYSIPNGFSPSFMSFAIKSTF